MIFRIAALECVAALRRPSTWVYLFVYTSLGVIWTLAFLGLIPGMDISMGSEKLMVNSPYVASQIIALVSLFGIFTVAGIMGRMGGKDFLCRTDALVFSKTISRFSYLTGRFLGAYAVLLLIFAGVPAGVWIAVHSGLPAPDMIGPDSMRAYLSPFLFSVWPNLFAGGAFFFTLVALTRRMTAVYAGCSLLLLGWLMASGAPAGADDSLIFPLLDPSGIHAADRITLYWSAAEKNSRMVPLSGIFLWNRLLWVGFGTMCLALLHALFSFSPAATQRRKKTADPREIEPVPAVSWTPTTPAFGSIRRMWLRLAVFELKAVLVNRYFAVTLASGILFMIMSSMDMGRVMGTPSFPVTYQVLEQLGTDFQLFILMIIAFYSGEIVHRERDTRMDQMIGSLPVSGPMRFSAKTAALAVLVLSLLSVVFLSGVGIQLARGWNHLNIPLYVADLLLIRYTHLLMICVLALFVHVLLNNKGLGHLAMILYFLVTLAAPRMGLGHPLLLFAEAPSVPWSDMNGYGAALLPHLAYMFYWSLFCGILLLGCFVLKMPGASFYQRFLHQTPGVRRAMFGFTALWLICGAFLFYQSNVATSFETGKARLRKAVLLEKQYAAYQSLPGFSVDHADYSMDLFPHEGKLVMEGTYILENRQPEPLDLIRIHAGPFLEFSSLEPGSVHEREVFDRDLGFYVFRLNEPIAPGGLTRISFAYTYQRPFLPAGRNHLPIYKNGTHLSPDFFPMTGFPMERLLESERMRKRHGLGERFQSPGPDEPGAGSRSGLGGDTTWASMRFRVSTVSEQIPMVPAPLVSSREENGRRISLFDTGEEKVMFMPTLVSAEYEVARDRWQNVDLEIYYHPEHYHNIHHMMDGLKESLDYCSSAFGPYPHRVLRILEFPRHDQFAISLAATVPFSEALGFIAQVDDSEPGAVNLPFFVTAHETAHQWWPHQVMPADAKGANFLSESLAHYTAINIVKRKIGREHMRTILGLQRHMYLKNRADSNGKEPILLELEDEEFVAYYKGGLALYTLADRIGEDRVNLALRRYLAEFGGREDRFPVSTDLVRHLLDVSPVDHHVLIEDLFRHITFHDLAITSVRTHQTSRGTRELVVSVSAVKMRADSMGVQQEVPMNDELEIAFINSSGNITGTRRFRVAENILELTIPIEDEVVEVVLDPFHAVLDTNLEDNRIAVPQ